MEWKGWTLWPNAKYKVVQIWPGQTVTCLHTNSPGHIWTTLYFPGSFVDIFPWIQGGSNMTWTNCDLFTHNQSRSYLNHLVYTVWCAAFIYFMMKVCKHKGEILSLSNRWTFFFFFFLLSSRIWWWPLCRPKSAIFYGIQFCVRRSYKYLAVICIKSNAFRLFRQLCEEN